MARVKKGRDRKAAEHLLLKVHAEKSIVEALCRLRLRLHSVNLWKTSSWTIVAPIYGEDQPRLPACPRCVTLSGTMDPPGETEAP